MKLDEQMTQGFITTTSKVHRGSFKVTCLTPRNTIKLVITVGARSENILRVEASSPTIGNITEKNRVVELISTVRCACSECIQILKEWNHDSTSS